MLKLMKQRIVLASATEQENVIIKRKLDPIVFDLGPTQFLSVRPQGVSSTLDNTTSLIILNTQTFNSAARQSVTDSRRLGYKGPIMLVSKVDMLDVLDEIRRMENVVLLQRPYEVKDLQGLVRKSMITRKVSQQVHRRFNTVQRAHVEMIGKTKAATTLFNLSRGGCYFEYPNRAEIKVGDIVNMTIELDEVKRSYAMPAKVVWTTPVGQSGGHGVGVEFLGKTLGF
jgi:hypothetical protein